MFSNDLCRGQGRWLTLDHCDDMDVLAAMDGGGRVSLFWVMWCCFEIFPHPLSREFGKRPDSLCTKIAGQTVCVRQG